MIADTGSHTTDIEVLLRRAQDEGAPADEARAVGTALAEALVSQNRVYEAPLATFTAEAYLAFDARVAALQAEARGR